MRGLWRVYVAVGAVLICLYVITPSGIPRDAIYVVVGVGSVIALVVGARMHQPRSRAPWYLFAAGQAAWVTGDALYSWYEDIRQVSPFPSGADVAYLLAYPLLTTGIGLLIRGGGRRFDVRALIDSFIVVAALGLVSWAFIAQPMVEADGVPLLERAIAVAYPVGDILMLAMLVRLVAAPGVTSVALRLLVGAVVLQVVADTGLAAGVSETGTYMSGLDLVWLGSYVLWGACALHPQMRELSRRPGVRSDLFTMRRVVVLGAAAVLPPTTALVALTLGRSPDAWLSVGGTMVLTLLVVARMASAIVEVRLTTRQRDRLEEELLHRAADDPLTGLFNRAFVLRAVGDALRRARTASASTGLIVVDLDDFKALNDDLGPVAGDDVLVEVARRISDAAGPSRPVGRLHGDQFVVLVEHADAVETTTRLAGQLAARLARPHEVSGHVVTVRAKIGVAVSMDGGTDASGLVHQALIASRRAAESPTGPFEVFDDDLRRELAERADVEDGLRRAMRDDDLELYYQPVVAVRAVVVDGYEALLRWNRGAVTVMPDAFVPVAEKSDLICDVGRWVLQRATRQFADWLAADPDRFSALTVAVNISGRHLTDRRIVDDVADALRDSGLPAHHLVVEVTETVLVDEPHAMIQLGALRALGVAVSLDDFGTGYTSIGQLSHLPVDTIKIDRSFLSAAGGDGSSELVALMTAAAHACGMQVVVEGVERVDQLGLLQDLDCDRAQGFLFAAPLTSDTVSDGSTADPLAYLRPARRG
jgi:diguanylate cyclase (GGDEF)-like protein